eukprot:60151-Pelagomonas_calceolata.AAC.3
MCLCASASWCIWEPLCQARGKLAGGQGGGSAASHADLQALRATLVEARKEAAQVGNNGLQHARMEGKKLYP